MRCKRTEELLYIARLYYVYVMATDKILYYYKHMYIVNIIHIYIYILHIYNAATNSSYRDY